MTNIDKYRLAANILQTVHISYFIKINLATNHYYIDWNPGPSNFQIKEKKNYSNRSSNKEIGLLLSRKSFGESTISDFEPPSNFQVKEEKKYSNRSRNNEI